MSNPGNGRVVMWCIVLAALVGGVSLSVAQGEPDGDTLSMEISVDEFNAKDINNRALGNTKSIQRPFLGRVRVKLGGELSAKAAKKLSAGLFGAVGDKLQSCQVSACKEKEGSCYGAFVALVTCHKKGACSVDAKHTEFKSESLQTCANTVLETAISSTTVDLDKAIQVRIPILFAVTGNLGDDDEPNPFDASDLCPLPGSVPCGVQDSGGGVDIHCCRPDQTCGHSKCHDSRKGVLGGGPGEKEREGE